MHIDPLANTNKVPWIRPGQITIKPKTEPLADKEVSQIVGRKVLVNDPRLIKKIAEWSRHKNPEEMDYFLKDPQKQEELKKLFN